MFGYLFQLGREETLKGIVQIQFPYKPSSILLIIQPCFTMYTCLYSQSKVIYERLEISRQTVCLKGTHFKLKLIYVPEYKTSLNLHFNSEFIIIKNDIIVKCIKLNHCYSSFQTIENFKYFNATKTNKDSSASNTYQKRNFRLSKFYL